MAQLFMMQSVILHCKHEMRVFTEILWVLSSLYEKTPTVSVCRPCSVSYYHCPPPLLCSHLRSKVPQCRSAFHLVASLIWWVEHVQLTCLVTEGGRWECEEVNVVPDCVSTISVLQAREVYATFRWHVMVRVQFTLHDWLMTRWNDRDKFEIEN